MAVIPGRLECGGKVECLSVARRPPGKRYGRDEYPVRHIRYSEHFELLQETNAMPSRRVAVDLNAGTYYLTLTIQRWYYLFERHNRWQILA
ncbi:MAG: hypothetical protein WCH01_21705, partial [Methylococcaceae bacterium]